MGTSVAAGGKIYLAADRGEPIPARALDAAGDSTTDPSRAKIWLQLGPKGFGLAMMFECWSSLLAANAVALPVPAGGSAAAAALPSECGLAAVDVAAFSDLSTYRCEADAFADAIKALPPAGDQPVMLPGDQEEQIAIERRAKGIPLPAGTVQRLGVTAARLGLDPLLP